MQKTIHRRCHRRSPRLHEDRSNLTTCTTISITTAKIGNNIANASFRRPTITIDHQARAAGPIRPQPPLNSTRPAITVSRLPPEDTCLLRCMIFFCRNFDASYYFLLAKSDCTYITFDGLISFQLFLITVFIFLLYVWLFSSLHSHYSLFIAWIPTVLLSHEGVFCKFFRAIETGLVNNICWHRNILYTFLLIHIIFVKQVCHHAINTLFIFCLVSIRLTIHIHQFYTHLTNPLRIFILCKKI